MKRSLLAASVATVTVAATGLLGVAPPAAMASVTETASSTTSGSSATTAERIGVREILESVYFDQGPLASAFRADGLPSLGNGNDCSDEVARVVDDVMANEPEFVASVAEAARTSDPYLLHSALKSGGELMKDAAVQIGIEQMADGSNTGAITAFSVVFWLIPMVLVTPTSPGSDTTPHGVLKFRSFSDDESTFRDIAAIADTLSSLRDSGTLRSA